MFNKKLISSVFSSIFVILFLVLTIFSPKQIFSQEQNKLLSTLPPLSATNFVNKNYASSFEKYLADHIFLREPFLKLSNNFMALLGKNTINQTFITYDRLVENPSMLNAVIPEKNTAAIQALFESHPEYENFRFALIPTASEIYKDELPNSPTIFNQLTFINDTYSNFQASDTIDIYTGLLSQKSENLFYSSDSNWTSYGAFIGYSSLTKGLGFTSAAKNMFNIEYLNEQFYGNLYNKTLIKPRKTDSIDLYHYAQNNVGVSITSKMHEEITESSSLYYRDFLLTPNKQRVFLGEDFEIMNIKTTIDNNESLLIFKDNFTNPLVQFLQLHYKNITLVDLKYADEETLKSIDFSEYSSVLFLYSVATFVQDNNIATKLSLLSQTG